jgi:hypothetical protein
MGYISLDTLRDWIKINDNVTQPDQKLKDCIEHASDLVDQHCYGSHVVDGGCFTPTVVGDGAPEPSAREFTSLNVDDFSTLVGLEVEVTSDWINWTALTINQDFRIGPLNAGVYGLAYYQIVPLPGSTCAAYGAAAVRVTTDAWGWPATPGNVKAATKLTAHKLSQRSGDPYAVASIGDLPSRVRADDPDVLKLLQRFVRVDLTMGIA